jgi:glycosyltransferase involved in cell wall biosynthesis
VLVISPTRFGTQTATGAVMTVFFQGWPKEAIAQIHSDAFSERETEVCSRYYHLRKRKSRFWETPVAREFADLVGPNGLIRSRLEFGKTAAWVRRFQPELIYNRVVDEPAFYRFLPLKLAKALNVPIVSHIMDDWPGRLDGNGSNLRRRIHLRWTHRCLRDLFASSAVNLSICDKMSEAFSARYGVPFRAFHNAIDKEMWSPFPRSEKGGSNDVFRVVYTGSISEDMQLQSLVDIADVVSELHMRGIRIQLEIFGAEWWLANYRRHLGRLKGVRHAGFVPRAEYPRILMEADLLILPVNFDEKSLRYVRYSMANKAPEYMASGTPVLVYGPVESATVHDATTRGWGYVVPERNRPMLEAVLVELMNSREQRTALGQRAKALAFSKHDAGAVRQRFRALMREVARREGTGAFERPGLKMGFKPSPRWDEK